MSSQRGDYQRSAVYRWEAEHVHPKDTRTVPFDQCQAIVDYVWARAGLTYPPKIRELARTARRTTANGDRLTISIPATGVSATVATRVATDSQPNRSCSVQHSNPPAAFYWGRPAFSCRPVSDRARLRRPGGLRGVEFPIALFDAASSFVSSKDDADVIWASPLASGGDFLLRLAGCQSKDLIPQGRRATLASRFSGCGALAPPSSRWSGSLSF